MLYVDGHRVVEAEVSHPKNRTLEDGRVIPYRDVMLRTTDQKTHMGEVFEMPRPGSFGSPEVDPIAQKFDEHGITWDYMGDEKKEKKPAQGKAKAKSKK